MYRASKSSLLGKITVLFVICCCGLPVHAKYGGGTGEPNDPYSIYTAEQMNEIGLSVNSDDWDRCFKLMADIDLSAFTGTSFNIIGTWSPRLYFTGIFDGNGHTISNFTYDANETNGIGLFVNVRGGEIKNLGLISPVVTAGTSSYVGSLVGYLRETTITNCNVEGGSISGGSRVGGLVGYSYYTTITNCYSSVSVSGIKEVGGLSGRNYSGAITSCYSKGTVTGTADEVGGLVGRSRYGTITNCYSRCSVSSNGSGGGLVGSNYYDSKIINCYSTGSVTGTTEVGGLVGSNLGYIFLCYWDIETSGVSESAGGEGKTTAEMKSMSTYYGWGYGAAWTINEGVDYPKLVWENAPGVPIEDPPRNYGGGSGTVSKPYLIYTAEHLNTIGRYPADLACHFKLMADIDLSGFGDSEFNIIGYVIGFSGVFDGNGHTISNFTYTSTDTGNIGLFGHVDGPNAEIKNLGLIDPNIDAGERDFVGSLVGSIVVGAVSNCYAKGGSVSGDDYVGGLVGWNSRDVTISNCYSTSRVVGEFYIGGLTGENKGSISDCYAASNVSGDDRIGGLVGDNLGTITNSYSTGNVSGIRWVGGLVGLTGRNTITNCYATGNVTGEQYVGGLVGLNTHLGAISNCYSTGSVLGSSEVGGLVGLNGWCDSWGCHGGIISNCYSTGSVTGNWRIGGLVGENPEGEVTNSFWDIETSGKTTSNGGVGLTTGEMQMAITFVCWGYEPVWTIDEGVDYPRLVWENKPGVLITVPSDLFGGGSGEPEDPYLIYTAEQLNMIGLYSCHWDKHFKLMEDIDLGEFTGTSFNIIGNDYDSPFNGVFDGNGRKIYNFKYTSTGIYRIGLFGWVSGVIKDLGLIDPNVDAGIGYYAGSLVGSLYDGTITNCYVEGGSVDGRNYIGGLVGENSLGIITNSHSSCRVSGYWYVGGLVGYNYSSTITNSYSTGSFSGTKDIGGLVGRNRNGTITSCYAAGDVSSEHAYTGGLVGNNYRGTIDNCYSTGSVTGTTNVGGLVGESELGTITNSYSNATVLGDRMVGGLVGHNGDTITNSYSTASVSGTGGDVGGLVGENGSDITNSYSTASVSGSGGDVGGLVGENGWDGIITNSYSTGSVAGWNQAGGLVGGNYRGTITNCYARNNVTGNERVGGLVGYNYYGEVIASFWDIETGGPYNGIGTPLPTEQMQMAGTFTNVGWDFVGETFNGIEDIWFIGQQDYPRLWWEGMQVPMKLTPRTLNCRSYGNWVKAHLTLPEGFTVAYVDSNRPAVLHSFGFESTSLYVFVNKNEPVQIEATFERQTLCSLAGDWPDVLTVVGFLTDGNIFLGSSTVRINHPGMKVIEELAIYWLSEDCVQPEWCDQIDTNRDSIVNLPDYALLMNIEVEFVTDE